jgi:cell division protein FtsW
VICWIAFQALINIGGITRSIPLTGIPLPFVSYGGSSLIMIMAGVGILLNVSRYSQEHAYAEQKRVAKAKHSVRSRPRAAPV